MEAMWFQAAATFAVLCSESSVRLAVTRSLHTQYRGWKIRREAGETFGLVWTGHKRRLYWFSSISDFSLLVRNGRMAEAAVEIDQDHIPLHVLQQPP